MRKFDLPAEIWTQVFDLAADENVIFDPSIPTVMAKCAWFPNVFKEWTLRTPEESLRLIQRRSYATKKAIISACKSWRRLGSEFLFRCLFFDEPGKLRRLSEILDEEPKLGWWTRRIHLTRYYAGRSATMDDMENALKSVIRHCPNLEIFIIDWPMNSGFGPIADALCTYCKNSLRAVHWNVPSEALPKVIWAIDSLPNLVSIHIDFEKPRSETIHLGAAAGLRLQLPGLQQLSLRGFFQDFLEQSIEWALPALRSVSLDSGTSCHDLPDVMEFLMYHGAELTFLSLDLLPSLDVPTILDICPLLTSFAFNADWSLPAPAADPSAMMATLVRLPHLHITHIGLHGLLHAFGVGYSSSPDGLQGALIARANDRNVNALLRENFPSLQCVRILGRSLLRTLNESDGPDEKAHARWVRWWDQCSRQGVRLEDCTGSLMGTLPDILQSEDEDEDDEDDEDEDEDDDEGEEEEEEVLASHGEPLSELRQLLEECRKMSAEREEPRFTEMSWQGAL